MLYIFDNTENLITTLPEGSFFDAVHREVLNGENTFQFTVPADNEYVVEGNLVAFRDLDSYWQVFEIKRLVDQHGDGLTRTAFCEHILYELLDDIVIDKRPSADATAALAGMLEGTRWQAGIVDDLGASSTSAYYISALEAVQKVAEAWQGELNWRCVISGGVITRYVDLRAMVGTDTGKQFAYSKDILSIEREVDTSGVVTALYGRGKGIELESGSYGRRLTFAEIEAADKPAGQEWIGDSDALAQWGRNGRHRFDVFIDEEETDAEKLLEKTRAELARRKDPRVTYRLDVVSLELLTDYEHEKVRKGDLVRVIDREFTPKLIVSARVIDIERDILDPANTKVVLGSFAPTIVEATINTQRRVDERANRPFNTKWLDGKISVLQNAIESAMSNWWTDENGNLIFEAQDGLSAMKLAGEGFAIANQKNGDGTWNWRTFGTGSGFNADLMTTGILDAALVQIGHATTFESGYDPTQIVAGSTVGMGVDSDCLGLWHFDGSLNSHKGVAVDSDGAFGDGCFGQALNIATGKKLKAPTTGMDASAGTVNLRAKNLSESANGSVLVDLPKSDNTQGIKAGIANDGKLYISDSDKVSKSYTETTQADFNSGTLTDVTATSAGDLELKQTMGKALSFDGVDDYVDIGSSLQSTSQMTIEGKIKLDDYSKQRNIISNNLGTSTAQYTMRIGTNGKLEAGICTTSKIFWVGNVCDIEKNTEIHLASVINSTNNTYAVYKNGNIVASGTLTDESCSSGTGKTFIGKDNRNQCYFDGIIDDVRIWNVARTQQQIQDNMNRELIGNETGLVGYWKFNEGTGTTAYDSTANGNNGTINGATWVDGVVPSDYKSSGTRIKEVDISGANPAGGTKIEWSKTTPTNTTVKVETALSTDGGSTYGDYAEATSGNGIPGIASDTDLSNARLKIRETLSTTDTSKTPQLHSLTFNIWEKQASTAYGPNKSTLTAWDSISLAWKSDRLSLVVNDTEACYIENPGLPTAFGSYLYIGTDRNGANAINTLVDELRIDKVYRDAAIRTGWYKTGVPFYTSEDMKQWPGYLRAETDGLKVYDSSNALRVLLGSWLKDAIRKYGIKIIDGEIHSSNIYGSNIRSGAEGSNTYISITSDGNFRIVLNGKTLLETYTDVTGGGSLYFFRNDGSMFGRIIRYNDMYPGFTIEGTVANGGSGPLTLRGSSVTAIGNFSAAGGTKNCIEETSYGRLAISARESPEVRYIDEGMGTLSNGGCRIDVDPIFMECIEPHTPDSRWYIQLTPYGKAILYVDEIGDDYFIVKDYNGNANGIEFTWSLSATRKDYALIRFMEVLD